MRARLKAKTRGSDPRDRGSTPRPLTNHGRLTGIQAYLSGSDPDVSRFESGGGYQYIHAVRIYGETQNILSASDLIGENFLLELVVLLFRDIAGVFQLAQRPQQLERLRQAGVIGRHRDSCGGNLG